MVRVSTGVYRLCSIRLLRRYKLIAACVQNGHGTSNHNHRQYRLLQKLLARRSLSVSVHVTDLSPRPSVGLRVCVGRSVCLSVRKVYCGKTSEWIRMPFGVVRGIGRGMGVLDGSGYLRRGKDNFGVNLGRPIVTNGNVVA